MQPYVFSAASDVPVSAIHFQDFGRFFLSDLRVQDSQGYAFPVGRGFKQQFRIFGDKFSQLAAKLRNAIDVFRSYVREYPLVVGESQDEHADKEVKVMAGFARRIEFSCAVRLIYQKGLLSRPVGVGEGRQVPFPPLHKVRSKPHASILLPAAGETAYGGLLYYNAHEQAGS